MKNQRVVEPVQPPPYYALIIQYSLTAIYGVAASVTGVATLNAVAGDYYGVIWPGLVVVTSLAALVGVIISKATGRHWVEFAGTIALIVLLGSYSVAIVIRSVETTHDYSGLAFSLLPLTLCVAPYAHLINVVRRSVKS